MKMFRVYFVYIVLLKIIFAPAMLNGQDFIAPADLEKKILQFNLKPLAAPSDSERIKASYEIQDLLLEGLLNPASFNYPLFRKNKGIL